MTLFFDLRLRTRLAVMALIAVLPALVVIAYTQTLAYRSARERAIEDALHLGRLAASQQGFIVDEARLVTDTLARLPVLRSDNARACEEVLRRILSGHPAFIGIGAVDPHGSTVCSSSGSKFQNGQREWFQRAVLTGTATVGVFQISPVTGTPSIVVAQPMLGAPGSVERIAFAAIDLRQLQRLVSALTLPAGATLTIVDRNHTVLARSPDSAQWLGRLSPDVPTHLQFVGNSDEIGDAVGRDGVSRLYATVPVHAGVATDLYVTMSVEHSVAFAEADRLLHQQLWLVALLSLAAIATAWIGGRTFVLRPLDKLKTSLESLAAGHFGERAESTAVPGLHELGDAINAMATALETRERERQRSDERYREMFMSNLMGAWIASAHGKLIACNPAFASMFGFDSVEGTLGMDLVSIYDNPGEREEFVRLLGAKRRVDNRETTFRRRDGTPLHAIQTAVGVFNDAGDLVEIRGYLIDATERKHLEDQLRQSQKLEAVGRLAGGVAHDFNNLLMAILGYCDSLLIDPGLRSSTRADVEEIQKAGQSAASLTNQLLAFSRRQILQPRVLHLKDVVTRTESLLRRVIGEDIVLVKRIDERLGLVRADPGQIEQIIMNLAVNARDAMPNGGDLIIEARNADLDDAYVAQHPGSSPGRHVMLAITDTGIGMADEIRARIFEPFFTTKEPGKGTGLGLATVYGIVKQSGGSIWVYSEPARGTSFKIYLPIVVAPADEKAAPTIDEIKGGCETILVVEDQASVRSLIRKTLNTYGYVVLEAAHGEEALRVLDNHEGTVDLLLSDVVMPTMTGPELVERVRHAYPDMCVVYMSGYTDDTVVLGGVITSGTPFLQKPFTSQGILRTVRGVLDARRGLTHVDSGSGISGAATTSVR
jgi:two-component system, cell cycle sensor histidine kinase and response regulator CckA